MHLGVEMKTGGADALKQLGAAAKDAAEHERRHKEQLKESVQNLLAVSSAKEKILRATKEVTSASKDELKAEREYQQLLSNRIKQLEQAARLKKDLAAAGHVEAKATPGLGAAMMGGLGMMGLGGTL